MEPHPGARHTHTHKCWSLILGHILGQHTHTHSHPRWSLILGQHTHPSVGAFTVWSLILGHTQGGASSWGSVCFQTHTHPPNPHTHPPKGEPQLGDVCSTSASSRPTHTHTQGGASTRGSGLPPSTPTPRNRTLNSAATHPPSPRHIHQPDHQPNPGTHS